MDSMMKFPRGVWALVVASMLALMPAPSTAASAVMLTREQLVKRSDLVVRATAIEAQSDWNGDGTAIVTRTRLRVRSFLKGKGVADLWLEQYGGTVGDRTMSVPGDAHIEPGQELVLFLKRGSDGMVYLTALSQAAYHVKGDKVGRDMAGLVLYLPINGKLTPIEHKPEPREPLTRLLADIARAARAR
jgi:hypothetical protein